MEMLGIYLLQMTCWLLGFWLIYIILLRNETFFNVNRIFLLTGIAVSLLMPLFPVHYEVKMEMQAAQSEEVAEVYPYEMAEYPQTAEGHETVDSNAAFITSSKSIFESMNYWLLVYLAGVAFFVIRFLWQMCSLYSMGCKNKHYRVGNLQIIELKNNCTPFSFFGKVYISHSLRKTGEFNAVIAHERVHVEEHHWADLLLLELACTLQWFNPLLHLYRKAIMQNHEYLADLGSLKNGLNVKVYKMALANQMLGVPVLSIANGFTILNLKKRLTMMNKNRTKSAKGLNILWALPMAAVIVYVFAQPNYVMANNVESAVAETKATVENKMDIVESQLETLAEMPKVEMKSTAEPVMEKVVFEKEEPIAINMDNSQDMVLDNQFESTVDLVVKEDSVPAKQPEDKKVAGNVEHVPFNGLIVDITGEPVKGVKVKVKNSTKYTLSNGKGAFGLTDINPTDTLVLVKKKLSCEIPVMGRKSLKVKWLEDGYNANEDADLVNVGYGHVKRREFTGFSNGISGEDLRRTGQTDILKALQGRIPGLLISTTGPNPGDASVMMHGPSSINLDNTPMYVVDGIVVSDISYLSVYDVEYIEVMKNASIYGSRGANGAILITTRKK